MPLICMIIIGLMCCVPLGRYIALLVQPSLQYWQIRRSSGEKLGKTILLFLFFLPLSRPWMLCGYALLSKRRYQFTRRERWLVVLLEAAMVLCNMIFVDPLWALWMPESLCSFVFRHTWLVFHELLDRIVYPEQEKTNDEWEWAEPRRLEPCRDLAEEEVI